MNYFIVIVTLVRCYAVRHLYYIIAKRIYIALDVTVDVGSYIGYNDINKIEFKSQ